MGIEFDPEMILLCNIKYLQWDNGLRLKKS